MHGVFEKRGAAEARPPLGIALQRSELVQQFPTFSDLDDVTLKRLGRVLRTLYVNAGDLVAARNSAPKSAFFIASGVAVL